MNVVENSDNSKPVNVLGTVYKLHIDNPKQNPKLSEIEGYCDTSIKDIAVDGSGSINDILSKYNQLETIQKLIRHEIVHAFLYESGLDVNSDWATNEELVDWIALQGVKLYKAWKAAGAVDE